MTTKATPAFSTQTEIGEHSDEALVDALLKNIRTYINQTTGTWEWSIDAGGYVDGRDETAPLQFVVNGRALAEHVIHRTKDFCRDVLDFDRLDKPRRRRIIRRIAFQTYRLYLARLTSWYIHTHHMLTEAALSIAQTSDDELRDVDREISGGEPNEWLEKRTLREWLASCEESFRESELRALATKGRPRARTAKQRAELSEKLKREIQERRAANMREGRPSSQAAVLPDIARDWGMSVDSLDHVLHPRKRKKYTAAQMPNAISRRMPRKKCARC